VRTGSRPGFYPRRIEEDERIARLQTVIRAQSGRRSQEIGASYRAISWGSKFLLGLEEPEYELRCLIDYPLARIAVSMVPRAFGGLAIKMIVDLGAQNTFGQRLPRLVE
jgi:hypothetical protein